MRRANFRNEPRFRLLLCPSAKCNRWLEQRNTNPLKCKTKVVSKRTMPKPSSMDVDRYLNEQNPEGLFEASKKQRNFDPCQSRRARDDFVKSSTFLLICLWETSFPVFQQSLPGISAGRTNREGVWPVAARVYPTWTT